MSTPDRGELIVYRTEDGQAEVQLQTLDGSVWLNQGEMAELFDTTKQNVSLHIKHILKEKVNGLDALQAKKVRLIAAKAIDIDISTLFATKA